MISGDMQISDILSPAAVRTMSQITSKKRLFQEIAEQARSIYGVDAAQTLDALQERETLGPTGVGHGVALPHARLHGLDRVVGLFLRLEKPLDFDAVDRQPVDLIFALFAPPNASSEHLRALARVSRMLRQGDLREHLRQARTPDAIHALLVQERPSAAA